MQSELSRKVQTSIERIKAFAPEEGYYLAFSGGKDSVVCKALLDMAGVKYDAHYRVTSVDPPELVRFIRDKHPDVERDIPRYSDGSPITMWNLIPKKLMPPLRNVRYCCKMLKEGGYNGRKGITGVRWAESANRRLNQGVATIFGNKARREVQDRQNFKEANKGGLILVNDNDDSRRTVEQCYKQNLTNINPIIDWEDSDVWQFIKAEKVPYCELYDEGFQRLGCIGCPLASVKHREREFLRWPKFKTAYLKAFDRMLQERDKRGKERRDNMFSSPQSVFNWWMQYDILPGQIDLFEEEDDA